MYIFYKLIKFHKLVYRTLKIVTIETNIFFINLAEGYPPISTNMEGINQD